MSAATAAEDSDQTKLADPGLLVKERWKVVCCYYFA